MNSVEETLSFCVFDLEFLCVIRIGYWVFAIWGFGQERLLLFLYSLVWGWFRLPKLGIWSQIFDLTFWGDLIVFCLVFVIIELGRRQKPLFSRVCWDSVGCFLRNRHFGQNLYVEVFQNSSLFHSARIVERLIVLRIAKETHLSIWGFFFRSSFL